VKNKRKGGIAEVTGERSRGLTAFLGLGKQTGKGGNTQEKRKEGTSKKNRRKAHYYHSPTKGFGNRSRTLVRESD